VSFSRYAIGLVLLVAVVGSAAFGGVRLRRRLLPRWTGTPARLAETMIALAVVLGVAELLGAAGLLRTAAFVVCCVVVGVGLGITTWPRLVGAEQRSEAPGVPGPALALALAGALAVLAQWAAGVEPVFHGGMTGPDTLGYHGPIAASIVQRASIVHPPYVYTDPAVTFFPATSELVHSIGILLFSRDVLSPFINLGWLCLGLLAGWCVGRPRGLGPASLLATAVVLDLPVFSSSQPGSADNDVVALALLVVCLALLFNGYQSGRDGRIGCPSAPVALAGIAAGLALATKVTMFAPVGLLAIAVAIALPGARSRIVWLLAVVGASGVWFARNLIAFGNPVPEVHLGIGPIAFPSARIPTGLAVYHHLFDGASWRHLFLPGLGDGFTFMWPVLLAVALAGAILVLLPGPTRIERMLGPVALLAAVAYALTPRTGFPFLFTINLRYLGPAILIGTMLLFRVPRIRSVLRQAWLLAVLGAAVIIDLADRGRGTLVGGFPTLDPTPHFAGTTTMWVGVIVIAAVTVWVLSGRLVILRGGLALVALAALGLVVWPAERTYLRTRYTTGPLVFARAIHHQRMAIVGFLQPYPAYGLDLSNSVTEISHHGPHGAQTLISSCREWRRSLATGHYDYVITSAPYRLIFTSAPDYAAWTRGDPAATPIEVTPDGLGGAISVFRLRGTMHPNLCA